MIVEDLIKNLDSDFYVGVPDSQLKPLCDYLMASYGIDSKHHIIAANEGNCVALAAGYYFATGKIPVIYMQNSGEGNIINPLASLMNENVYAIPAIFIIGWRGEPGVKDEPQHIYQGKVTLSLLEDMGIKFFVIREETSFEELSNAMEMFKKELAQGRDVAFVVCKNAFSCDDQVEYKNTNTILREDAIRHIVKYSGRDPIICTTGKASRELFEIRESNEESHEYDFLTVGSMGHGSSIALGIAINKKATKVWCIDGDGAFLMHMGAVALIGAVSPANFIHIVINNGAHETVGGMPTVAEKINIIDIAKACGYSYAVSVSSLEELDSELEQVKFRNELTMIEIKCAIGSRKNLGRPTTSTQDNKNNFMNYLKKCI